jgi:hypothetical protein
VYGSRRAGEVGTFTDRLTEYVGDVTSWMRYNSLQMNACKTDYMWLTRPRCVHPPPADAITIGGHDLYPVASSHNLGAHCDSDSTRRHSDIIYPVLCGAALIPCSLSMHVAAKRVMQSLVRSLVQSRLDCSKCFLFGLPASSVRRLQTVQNAAARLVFNIRRSDRVTDALLCLHWLRVA